MFRCGLWASSGPFPLSAHYGLYKRGRDPATNPSCHLKKERSPLPLKWLLKEDQGRRTTAASTAAAPQTCCRRARRRDRRLPSPCSRVPCAPSSRRRHCYRHLRPPLLPPPPDRCPPSPSLPILHSPSTTALPITVHDFPSPHIPISPLYLRPVIFPSPLFRRSLVPYHITPPPLRLVPDLDEPHHARHCASTPPPSPPFHPPTDHPPPLSSLAGPSSLSLPFRESRTGPPHFSHNLPNPEFPHLHASPSLPFGNFHTPDSATTCQFPADAWPSPHLRRLFLPPNQIALPRRKVNQPPPMKSHFPFILILMPCLEFPHPILLSRYPGFR